MEQFKVISLEKNFYMKPDEYLNGWAKKCGWKASLVYDSLWRHADRSKEAFPSIELMAEEHGISTKSVMRGLQILIDFGIIKKVSKRSKSGKFLHNTYFLLEKSNWREPSPSQGDGLTMSPTVQNHVPHRDYKGTHDKGINKGEPIANTPEDILLAKRRERKAKKVLMGKPKANFAGTDSWTQSTPLSLPEQLDQQIAFDVAWEYKVSTGDVKATYKALVLSVESGNPYKITSATYIATLRKWVANGISRGDLEPLKSDMDIQMGILDWSPEAIMKRQLMQEKMEEMGL